MRSKTSRGRSMVRVRVRRCRERRMGMRAMRVVNGMVRTRRGNRRMVVGWRRGILCLLSLCSFCGYVMWW